MKSRFFRILTCTLGLMALSLPVFAQLKLVDSSTKVEYAIDWHLNGGTQNPSNKDYYTAEDGMVLASPTREGYTFNGWYANADLSGEKVTAIAKGETQKKAFYAGWVITKEQAVKLMQEQMVTVIPAGKKANLDDFAGTSGTQTINAYQISKYEITQELYMAVMGNNPSYFKTGAASGEVQEKRPVEKVSWYDACNFCNKLSQIMGLEPCYDSDYNCDFSANGFRLPTEGEWEVAARGGTAGGWDYTYSGSNSLYYDKIAWYEDNSFNNITDERCTHEVGKTKPNELGLYDMTGNVWEWCDSRYSQSSSYCVNRGGGYNSYDNYCSVSYRNNNSYPNDRYSDRGFRVARSSFTPEEEKAIAEQKANKLKSITENFVFVEGGTFLMGSYDFSDTEPVHNVTLSSYYVAKTEVTQAQWKAVMGNNPSDFKGDNRPVECVSWYDAIVFCNKLSMMDKKTPVYSVNGKTDPDTWNYKPCQGNSISGTITMNIKSNGYRLPTEAEWEFAAWGGKKRKGYKYSGSDNLSTVAWYCDNSGDQTHDVAKKAPNELGLYDMSGNVWEWCWDWYGSYGSNAQTNPVGPSSGSYRVRRGGSWYGNYDHDCRVAYRDYSYPLSRGNNLGFRLVRSAN